MLIFYFYSLRQKVRLVLVNGTTRPILCVYGVGEDRTTSKRSDVHDVLILVQRYEVVSDHICVHLAC